MSQDEVEQILPGWQAASQAVAQELAEWRRAPTVLAGHRPDPLSHDWGFTAEMVPGRSTIYPRGKLTGGSSAIDGALAVRGHPTDYDE